jgi:1,4-alpha-glucan branching enzyme
MTATSIVAKADLDQLIAGNHAQPHSILGAHPAGPGKTVIRTLRPEAGAVSVLLEGKRTPLEQLHPGGVFGGAVDVVPTE